MKKLLHTIKSPTFIQFAALFFVLAVFLFLRFYNLDQRIGFDWDQERDAFEVRKIIVEHKLTLIGPRVVNVHGFYLGPYYTYMIIPFYLLSGLHPRGTEYLVVFFGLAFFFTAYKVIEKLWGAKSAILFLGFWAINTLIIGYDITPWNVLPVPLGILLVWAILEKMSKDTKLRYWAILGFVLSLFLHFHFQFIFLIFFAVVFLFLNRKHNHFTWQKIGVALVSFAALFLPLLAFDLRHDFINTKLFFSFFLANPEKFAPDHFSWIPVLTNVLLPLTIIKNQVFAMLLYTAFTALTFYLGKQKKGFQRNFYYSAFAVLVATPIFFIAYSKRPSEYYFLFIYPFIFMAVIDFLLMKKQQLVLIFLLLLLPVLNIQALVVLTKPSDFSLATKVKAVEEVKKLMQGKKYNISLNTDPGRNNGFQYLIEYYKLGASGNSSDPLVEIVIPPTRDEVQVKMGMIGIKIPPELR